MLSNRISMLYKSKTSGGGGSIPGPTTLIGGNMSAGYFGVVPTSELFTGTEISNECEITQGTSQFNDTGWLKFAIDGKIIFKSQKTYRHTISWNHIHSKGCTDGTKRIVKDGVTYKVRLMRGSSVNPATGWNGVTNRGSEWNRLMLPIHVRAKTQSWGYPNNLISPTEYWGIDFTDSDLLTHINHGKGHGHLCQEVVGTSESIYRGHLGVSFSNSEKRAINYEYYGWSPVLEVVGD